MTDENIDYLDENQNVHVIYHDNCLDGFTSAWAVEQKFRGAELIPAQHGEDLPDGLSGESRVIIVDFCYPRDKLLELANQVKSIEVYDHHYTASKNCGDLPFVHIDQQKAACEIVWEKFHTWRKKPAALSLIGARDIWSPKHRDVYTKASPYFSTIPKDLEAWDKLMLLTMEEIKVRAEPLWEYVRERHKHTFRRAWLDHWDGFLTAFINCEPIDTSDVANMLLKEYPQADLVFAWFARSVPEGKVFQVSLRSRRGGVNVAEVAQRYGGGGHPTAAGFRTMTLPRQVHP